MLTCVHPTCYRWSEYEHHYGFCAYHWAKLTPAERAIAAGREPQQVIERVRTVYPARSWLAFVTLWVWRISVSVLTAWTAWTAWRQMK